MYTNMKKSMPFKKPHSKSVIPSIVYTVVYGSIQTITIQSPFSQERCLPHRHCEKDCYGLGAEPDEEIDGDILRAYVRLCYSYVHYYDVTPWSTL